MKRVAGIGIDGSNVTLTLGTLTVPLVSSNIGDSLSTEWQPNMGSQERGEQSDGTYTCEDGKIVMSSVVFRTIFLPALPQNGFGNVRVPVVLSYSHPELGDDSDLCESCRFMGLTQATENSAKVINVEFTLTMRQIRWGDSRKTINRLDGVEYTGENGLGA